MMLEELDGAARRQLIDTQQVYEAWRVATADAGRRFAGSMRWAKRNETEYLLRKVATHETSLGPRSPKTEAAHKAFMEGREANRARRRGLAAQLDRFAPINRAMGLARVPLTAARILRQCDERGLLGGHIFVVGTNALFAYEALAGVRIASDLTATVDIDLLYDARRHLSLTYNEVRASGLIGLLRRADRSFSPLRPRGFRAVNDAGYMVDLIRPEPRDVFRSKLTTALTDLPDDLEGAAIFGLDWLINAPKREAVPIDERGYPVRMVVIDPRAFALHKSWVADRPDREPLKVRRDRGQALAAAQIALSYLGLAFDSADMAALPATLRQRAPQLDMPNGGGNGSDGVPDW